MALADPELLLDLLGGGAPPSRSARRARASPTPARTGRTSGRSRPGSRCATRWRPPSPCPRARARRDRSSPRRAATPTGLRPARPRPAGPARARPRASGRGRRSGRPRGRRPRRSRSASRGRGIRERSAPSASRYAASPVPSGRTVSSARGSGPQSEPDSDPSQTRASASKQAASPSGGWASRSSTAISLADAVRAQRRHGDGDVVHRAEAPGRAGRGVVEPAEQVQRRGVRAERLPRPRERPAAREPDGRHDLVDRDVARIDREDPRQLLGSRERLEQLRRVHAREVLVRRSGAAAGTRSSPPRRCPAATTRRSRRGGDRARPSPRCRRAGAGTSGRTRPRRPGGGARTRAASRAGRGRARRPSSAIRGGAVARTAARRPPSARARGASGGASPSTSRPRSRRRSRRWRTTPRG